MGSKIYLTALLITLSSMGRCQQPITCNAGRFKAGETASVTCIFHRSLKDTEHHVRVVQYSPDAPDDSLGSDIVKCHRSNGNKLICNAAKGVQINSDITDRLTFRIPEVTTDFAGRYMCQLVPPEGTVIVFCILTVEETTDAVNIAQPGEGSSLFKYPAIAVLCVVFIIILVIASFFLIRWKCFRRRQPSRKDQNRTHQVADTSFGRADSNGYSALNPNDSFNNEEHDTVSCQPDSPHCKDEPNTQSQNSPCGTPSLINPTVKVDMRPDGRKVKFDPSISVVSDDDSTDTNLRSPSKSYSSGDETDGNASFHSCKETFSDSDNSSTSTIVSDQAGDGVTWKCFTQRQPSRSDSGVSEDQKLIHQVVDTSVSREDSNGCSALNPNDSFNNEKHDTVSGQPDSRMKRTRNDQVDMRTVRRLNVRFNPDTTSVSLLGGDDSTDSNLPSSSNFDDSCSGDDTDRSSSFYSCRETNSISDISPTSRIVSDQAGDGVT